jgi:hypothetical protein
MVWWLAACTPDPTDPELAWQRVLQVLPHVPVWVSRCERSVDPGVRGVVGVNLFYESGSCRPTTVEIWPRGAEQGGSFGTTYTYRRYLVGGPPQSGGRWVEESLPEGWYVIGEDNF